jgi:VCBS repeat-containing protein
MSIADSTGAVASSTVTVTLTGINQAPVIAPVGETSLDEQTDTQPLNATIAVTFTDVDLNNVGHEAAVVGVAVNGEDGGLTLDNAALMALVSPGTVIKNAGDSNGSVDFFFTADSTVFDYLADGEVVTLTYTVEIDDGDGGTTLQTFDVVITGTNDAPVIVALGAIDQASKTIGWTFTLADAAIDWLALGESLVQTYTVTIDDGNGGTVDQLVTVTITGTNDAPTIVAEATDASASVTELADTTGSSFEHVAAGSIAFADVDLSDAHSASFAPGDSGYLGTFSLGGVDAAGNTVGWTFTVTDSQIDHLPKDTTLIQTYVVTISDGNGGTVQQVVTITINGSNDAPVIVVDGDDVDSAVLEEADEPLTADGTLTVSDVSVSDVVTAEVTAVVAAGDHNTEVAEATLLGFMQVTSPVIGSTDTVGTLTWNFDSNGEFFDFLANGETLVLTYTITVSDGTTTATHPVTITILGTNDQPVITAEVLSASVAETLGTPDEDDTLGDSGLITFTDLDLSDGHSVAVNPQGTPLGTLVANLTGTATGGGTGEITWTYTVDANLVEHLAAGESLNETFEITLSDGNGGSFTRTVMVTVTGSNDVPVITSEMLTGSVAETLGTPAADATLGDSGAISFTDVDLIDVHSVTPNGTFNTAASTQGAPLGTLVAELTASATGGATGEVTWTYTVDAALVEHLAQGQILKEAFDITLSDGEGGLITRTIVVTISGTNDAPVIAGTSDVTGAVTENAADDTTPSQNTPATGQIDFSDVDTGDTPEATVSTAAGDVVLVYTPQGGSPGALPAGLDAAAIRGAFSIGTDGAWTYDASALDLEALGAGDTIKLTYTVVVTDDLGATDTVPVVITITGTNDAPVVDLNGAGAGIDNAVTFDRDGPVEIAADGTLSDIDSDTLQSMTVTLTARPDGDHESLSLTAAAMTLALSAGLVVHAYDPANGTLLITGEASLAEYEAVLQGIVYNNTSERPIADDREIDVVVSDGDLSSTVATTTVEVIPAPDVISFAWLTVDDPNPNEYQTDDLGSQHVRLFAIVGDGDQALESGETAYRLSNNDNSQGGILNNNTGNDSDPVLITPSDENVTFEDETGFGVKEKGASGQVNDAFLNDGESINFLLTGGMVLAVVAFTVNASGASANVLIDFNGQVFDLGNLPDGTRVVIDFNNKTIDLGVNPVGFDTADFFSAFKEAGSNQITIGSSVEGDPFSIQGLQLTPKEASGTDPIILDLGAPGFDLSATAAFDLNNDGEQQLLGWPSGEDGILVMDVDGSGAIESGNEVFSPYFDGGGYADALEALASLDLNGDGLIDAQDAAFADLLVWVDANSDGQSQSGELFGLADLGIASLNLNAQTADYEIDGQSIVAEGLFTYADGTTGGYVAVELSEAADAQSQLFAVTDLSIHEVIVDYDAGDVIDLTQLGFALATGQLTADAAGEFVRYDSAEGSLFVDVDGAAGPEPFVLAAELRDAAVERVRPAHRRGHDRRCRDRLRKGRLAILVDGRESCCVEPSRTLSARSVLRVPWVFC